MEKPTRPLDEILRDIQALDGTGIDCTALFQEMIDSHGGLWLDGICGEFKVNGTLNGIAKEVG